MGSDSCILKSHKIVKCNRKENGEMSPSELSSADSRIVILLLFECETDSPIDGWIAKIAKIAKVVPLRLCLECFTFAAVRATRRSPAPAPGGQDGASDRCCGGEQEGTRRLREERERGTTSEGGGMVFCCLPRGGRSAQPGTPSRARSQNFQGSGEEVELGL